jgi:hypothetical protein
MVVVVVGVHYAMNFIFLRRCAYGVVESGVRCVPGTKDNFEDEAHISRAFKGNMQAGSIARATVYHSLWHRRLFAGD